MVQIYNYDTSKFASKLVLRIRLQLCFPSKMVSEMVLKMQCTVVHKNNTSTKHPLQIALLPGYNYNRNYENSQERSFLHVPLSSMEMHQLQLH